MDPKHFLKNNHKKQKGMVLKISMVKELELRVVLGFMVGLGLDRWSNR